MLPFPDLLRQAQLLVSTAFQEGVESLKDGVDLLWQTKTKKVSIPGVETVVFPFLAEQPQFKKWIGERTPKRLHTVGYSLTTEPYEYSYEIGKNELRFDRFGLLTDHPKGGGRASRMFYEKLVNAKQVAGATTTCVDGQFFYDTDHPQALDGSGSTFSNSRFSMALNVTNVVSGMVIMAGLVDANGDNMGVMPNILEYGVAQWAAVRDIFQAEITAQAIETAIGQEIHPVSNAQGAGLAALLTPVLNKNLPAGDWYLHDTRNMMPFLLLEETAPTPLIARDDPRDPHVWEHNAFLFGAEARAGAGYGLPHNSQRNRIAAS